MRKMSRFVLPRLMIIPMADVCWDPESLPMDTIEQPGAGAEACIIRLEFTIGLAHS